MTCIATSKMATIQIKYYKRSRTTQSAEKVASNNDLLTNILLPLPIKSIIRLKSVSKHWLSVITSPRFSLLRNPHPLPPSGLFLRTNKPEYEYIPFDSGNPSKPPFRTLNFTPDYDGIRIIQSCNGLLFCCSNRYSVFKYYIYNPTTGKFATLPPFPRKISSTPSYSTVLAFDQSRSPHYKVISVRGSKKRLNSYTHSIYQIVIYSSQTGIWRVFCQPFTAESTNFRGGVYFNGAVHWNSFSNTTFYFKIAEEKLETMTMPQVTNLYNDQVHQEQTCNGPSYFGTSGGHLYHVETYGPFCTIFNVSELKKDYSTWFVRYHVDLDELPDLFPGPFWTNHDPVFWDRYRIQILDIVREEREDDSFLVLEIPGKVVQYNLAEKTFKKLYEYDVSTGQPNKDAFRGFTAFELIESLSCL